MPKRLKRQHNKRTKKDAVSVVSKYDMGRCIGEKLHVVWTFVQKECNLEKDEDVARVLLKNYFEATGRSLEQVENDINLAVKDPVSAAEDDNMQRTESTYENSDHPSNHFVESNNIEPNTINTDIENSAITTEENQIAATTAADDEKQIQDDCKENFKEVQSEEDLLDDDVDDDYKPGDDSGSSTDEINENELKIMETNIKKKKLVKRKVKEDGADDETTIKKQKVKKEPKTPKEPKEPKVRQKRQKKEVHEKEPAKPWININLNDHPDKFTIERVESYERKNRGNSVFEDMFSCLLCGQFKTIGKEVLEDHLEQHINKVFECGQCSYVGCSNTDMVKHKQVCVEEKKGRQYVCHLCGLTLVSKGQKVAHMGTMHGIAELQCKFCSEMFTTRHQRKMHYQTMHTIESQYCKTCKQGLSNISKEEYLKHIQGCEPGHQCQLCGKMFHRKQGLDHHVTYTHLKVRKFKCTLCPYTATTPDKLKLHVLAHNGIHPYNCDQCTFSCVQSYQLKSHMRTHTGEKPFKCDQCNYAAAWNVQLKEHKKAHLTDTAVFCQLCNIVFKNTTVLTMHHKKEHCNTIKASIKDENILIPMPPAAGSIHVSSMMNSMPGMVNTVPNAGNMVNTMPPVPVSNQIPVAQYNVPYQMNNELNNHTATHPQS